MLISGVLLLTGGAAALGWWVKQRVEESVGDDSGEAGPSSETRADDDAERARQQGVASTEPHFPVHMGTSVTAVTLGTMGRLLCPPLVLLSLPAFAVALVPLFKRIYSTAHGGHRGVALVELGAILGTLGLGYIVTTEVTMVLLLGSQWLVKLTEDRSRHRLLDVYEALPETALVEREHVILRVDLDTVEVGDVVHLEAGQIVPVDGVIVSDRVLVDERTLTGESRPVERGEGDPVYASTLVIAGRARVMVEQSGRDCVAGKIVTAFNHTADYRAEVRSRGQVIVEEGAWPTLGLSGLALVILGPIPAIATLYAAFGYTMRYAAPITVLTFLERTSRRGILVKDGRALERLAEVDHVVFDKTGTLTDDAQELERVHPLGSVEEDELLFLAASCEHHQSHPIAQAILAAATSRGVELVEPAMVEVEFGLGIRARVDGQTLAVGGERLMHDLGLTLPDRLLDLQSACEARGGGLVFVARAGEIIGALELSARVRPEASAIVETLHQRGVEVSILSGDRRGATQHLAEDLGVNRYFAEVLPQDKAQIIAELQAEGRTVCFVGDGINDAVALRQADVALSLAGASTIATDTAPIVLMSGGLEQLPHTFDLADELAGNLQTSAVMSVAPGVVCVCGIFAGMVGLAGAIALYNISLFATLGNSLRPLVNLADESAAQPSEAP